MPARKKQEETPEPLMASYTDEGKTKHVIRAASDAKTSTRTRRNKSATIERLDRFYNIDQGLVPFQRSSGSYSNKSTLSVRDAVILCQKAYWNSAIFRNTIDLMTEFSCSDVYFTGGSKKTRDFFAALLKKINLYGFQDKFFREYYRSGNVFVHRMDGTLQSSDLTKITQAFGVSNASSIKLPSRYVVLNPADIQIGGQLSFVKGHYYKVLTDYELERLRNPKTDEDREIVNNLPKSIRDALKKDAKLGGGAINLPLDPEQTTAVFYKKQDYEPFAVPMGFPVLEDINFKIEMRKMDMAVTRTMQQAILLITMGAKPEDGGVNQRNLEAMQKLFDNESIGRVLIADYTTKAEFVIPNIASILDPKKYAQVDSDIQIGLNNILISGDEKFANANVKMKVFVERLKQAREAFLNELLIPEIKRISKDLGFRSFPMPHFEDIDLRDTDVANRVYSRLIELGILTAEEGIEALQSGKLPTVEESLESQEEFLKLKKKGYYEPLIGAGAHPSNPNPEQGQPKNNQPNQPKDLPQPSGRPPQVNTPQSTKKVSPIGANETKYSLSKVQENMAKAHTLVPEVEKELRKIHNKKRLSKQQKEVAQQICGVIIANEEPKDWKQKVSKYCKNPVDTNDERITEINEIACEHQVDHYLASILYVSKSDD
tara:strand:+ start:1401 stop:3374 length:1974 start_codon:yes stop_codon:yes gene_type:complete